MICVVSDGERQLFELLYDKYERFVMYIVCQYIDNQSVAEECVNEVFLRLLTVIGHLEDVDSKKTRAFIRSVARNTAIDTSKKEHKNMYESEPDSLQLVSEQDVFEKVYVSDVLECIKKLPDIHRDILDLFVYHDLSAKEIAKVYKISAAAVRKRLSRARAALLQLLDEKE